MAYSIELRPAALRDLRAIPKEMLLRVGRKVDSLSDNPRPPGVEKLSGSENSYRVCVGDYRILYQIEDEVLRVLVVRVGHRRDIYRN
jgi:mRNA interferase RelE/StbE